MCYPNTRCGLALAYACHRPRGCQAAGVSLMSVSRIVNGRVRPETRMGMERVIAAVGYVPNGLARR
ncbi:MAG: LacI family DNA-binding transcriptional regulator [Chloroflexota bacterium]